MKTYELTITPISGFGTTLKGDTIFGHVCWQILYDPGLFGKSLNDLLSDYFENPFMVISSAFPKLESDGSTRWALKRPDLPLQWLFKSTEGDRKKIIENRKVIKSKKWLLLSEQQKLNDLRTVDYKTDLELLDLMNQSLSAPERKQNLRRGIKRVLISFSQPHNTINRFSGTTGDGRFAPFTGNSFVFRPGTKLALFIGCLDDIKTESVQECFRRIGEVGFGKDASTGLGKFQVEAMKEVNLSSLGPDNPNACYTLSPCVPTKGNFRESFYTPFVRFGRHGDSLAVSPHPFKNPILFADEGAVFVPENPEVFNRPFFGKALSGLSKSEPRTVAQGYSLYIPFHLEAPKNEK